MLVTEPHGEANDGSLDLTARAAKIIPGGVNSNFRLAGAGRFWASGEGSRIRDVDGNESIDYVLGMGTAILGHSPRAILDRVSAAQEQLQCPAGQQLAEVSLAETLVEFVPSAELVRIGCTGSEMVQLALRLARAQTSRSLVVKFEGHYHGWLDNIFAGTTVVAPPTAPAEVRPPETQTPGQSSRALEDLVVLPWNDTEWLDRFLALRGADVAALIMEPVLCNTGVIAPKTGYLEAVRALCDRYGIILIFDEVITGFRIHPGGAQAKFAVMPDLTVLGKALGAGFPIAALAGRRFLMDLLAEGAVMHGGTYNANAMSLAAAQAALDVLTDPRTESYTKLDSAAQLLVDGLREISQRHGGALAVQSCGPVVNTTFAPAAPIVDYRSYHSSDLNLQREFIALMDQGGVRVTGRGTWFISTAHSQDDVDDTLGRVDSVMQRLDR
ncbi:MAG: aspartate aminotransferase family protein [Acidimicrobiales bacterium]